MFIEKKKRKPGSRRKPYLRGFMIALIVIPAILFALHPATEQNLLSDGIALSVMICASVYIVHQGILRLIASYLG